MKTLPRALCSTWPDGLFATYRYMEYFVWGGGGVNSQKGVSSLLKYMS